jgi:hypothetical protein
MADNAIQRMLDEIMLRLDDLDLRFDDIEDAMDLDTPSRRIRQRKEAASQIASSLPQPRGGA